MTLLELFEEDVVSLHDRMQVDVAQLDGELPGSAELREDVAAVPVAARRGGDIVDLDLVDVGDEVIVAGTAEGIDGFEAEFAG